MIYDANQAKQRHMMTYFFISTLSVTYVICSSYIQVQQQTIEE